jgi:hypothetical protein
VGLVGGGGVSCTESMEASQLSGCMLVGLWMRHLSLGALVERVSDIMCDYSVIMEIGLATYNNLLP